MATVSITIPDDQVKRVVDAFVSVFDYNVSRDGSKNAFVKAKVVYFIKEVVKQYEAQAAAEAARLAAVAKAETDIKLT